MTSIDLKRLREALRAALPAELRDRAEGLAQVIAAVACGTLAPGEAQARLAQETAALRALAGKRVPAGVTIDFGLANDLSQVSISDVAGGDVVKLTVNLGPLTQQTISGAGAVGVGGSVSHSPIITGSGNTVIQAGRDVTRIEHYYEATRPGPPPPAFQVPYPPNPLFVGRDAELAELERLLLDGEAVALLPVLSGTGGIGKTQLASEFAHRCRARFPGGIFWLSMERPETVASQVAACGGPGGLDLPGWTALDFEGKIAAVRAAWRQPVARLLVFDNLEDPALLRDWRPTSGGTRLLLTSRRASWDAYPDLGVTNLTVEALHRTHSLELLQKFRPDFQASDAAPIAKALGDLPLALHLAGSFLARYRNMPA